MTMHEDRITELANGYKVALVDELQAKIALAESQTEAAKGEAIALATATESGVIDGKNADTRKRQAADALANSTTYQNMLCLVKIADDNAGHATIERQYHDALIGLTKAWLYSQSGH